MYQDLRRGWRVTSPNLEQCGLLRIEYDSLDELCQAEEEWRESHPALSTASPAERRTVAKALLDLLRRELAIKVDYLDANYQERIQQRSSQRLVDPWSIDEDEVMTHSSIAFPRASRRSEFRGHTFVSPRSGFGIYLRRQGTFPNYTEKQRLGDTQIIIQQLFKVLSVAGLVEVVHEAKDEHDLPGYQLPADAMIWYAGDGTEPFYDPVRMPRQSRTGGRINPFFTTLYREVAGHLKRVYAREHTAQVPMDERLKREDLFRKAKLPVLYCSPTMELGVDISLLNVVNMRNVPPTPANYAQRSGRAGRSGQPALVFTYCTTGSPHDQYFFKRPGRMVSGSVAPPRLDLANEDLIMAHVHAVWLAETGQSLGTSLKDILDLGGDPASLQLLGSVQDSIESKSARKHAALRLSRIFQSIESELEQASWYGEEWLQKALVRVAERFDEACDRWRNLYWAAQQQQATQHAVVRDASRSAIDKNLAARLRAEAEAQLRLLTDNSNVIYSDFYSYRYFASEGFLPGYNFPRLPLSAYIPARKRRKNVDEFLNRPRFLAISEFGPRAIIYHEGSRYVINKVILPVGEDVALTTSAKMCPACGYLHPILDDSDGPDLCERCNLALDHPLRSLFRMQNVATRRRDRINSDEEERLRMGYELITGVRFNEHDSQRAYRTAEVLDAEDNVLFRLTYGNAATIWRINLGWKRRRERELYGFLLDTERGYWQKNEFEIESDPDDPTSPMQQRVLPFVEDRRNCLLIEPAERLSIAELAALQPAIKGAIQVLYQLEDRELAAEPLPTEEDRRLILLYESAEGGAGILRQLMDDSSAMAQVAKKALELCHFDLDGNDLGRVVGAKEDCEAACYDCLMSYYNQRDHALLDRQLIRGLLLQMSDTTVKNSPGSLTQQEHLQRLKALCDSDLERDWLDFLEERNLTLPDEAQKLITQCNTRVDFCYGGNKQAAIFIDGPIHDHEDVATRDREIDDCLGVFNMGLEVIRFHYLADWEDICARHPGVFGKLVQV